MAKVRIYDVGGMIRDELLGIRSKDRDCCVVIEDPPEGMTVEQGYSIMREHLSLAGFTTYVESPENVCIRAHAPVRGELPADFTLARREGPYSDGRRPDWVQIGTFYDDMARRDFTVNAMARDLETGEIIDLFGGKEDIERRLLRFVGDPHDRIVEDALRVMRALRFRITKGFTFTADTFDALCADDVPELLSRISEERREGELRRMFDSADTMDVLDLICHMVPRELAEAMFSGRVRLTSTLKK